MDRQAVFDKVRDHLLTQRQVSQDAYMCRYRGPNGLKCAIGCLIPDELYTSEMEGKSVQEVLRTYPAVANVLGDTRFLQQLQNIHDCMPIRLWEEQLDEFATTWELNNG